jgi:hypothetical protein
VGQATCSTAMMKCTFGVAPAVLNVLPVNRVFTGKPAANMMDGKPFLNVAPFGMCQSLGNPAVAAATAAALGALTPMPCTPMTFSPWVPGSPTVLLGNMPMLNNSSKLICSWGGVIQINFAGQVTTQVP